MGVRHTESSLIVWSGTAVGQHNTEVVPEEGMTGAAVSSTISVSEYGADRFYDAGDKGCAYGPLDEIAALMRQMEPGQTLEIHATDATVAVDLAAWCRMTGHTLVDQKNDRYLVRHS